LSAALFDSIEVLSLNKQTAPLEDKLNLHSATAWVMSSCYFLYTALISHIAGVPLWAYLPVLAICLALIFCAATNRYKKYFLAMQMSYFVLLSLLGLLAHSLLMVK
jgi:ABC-type sulfate transport system permease component